VPELYVLSVNAASDPTDSVVCVGNGGMHGDPVARRWLDGSE
jgi:hypothetical protein